MHLIKIVQQTITAYQRIKVCKAFRTQKPTTDQLNMQIHTNILSANTQQQRSKAITTKMTMNKTITLVGETICPEPYKSIQEMKKMLTRK